MSYEKQTFLDEIRDADGNVTQEGTVITATHFQHIEEGIKANDTAIGANATAIKSNSVAIKTNADALGNKQDLRKCKPGLTVAVIGDSISTHPKRNVSEIVIEEADVGVELSAYPTYYDIGKTFGNSTTEDGVETTEEITLTAEDLEIGSMSSSNASNAGESDSSFLIRARTPDKIEAGAGSVVKFTAGTASGSTIRFRLAVFDSTGTFSAWESWQTADYSYTFESAGYFKILFGKVDGSAIVADDLTAFAATVAITKVTTTSVTTYEYEVTAETVGTELTFVPVAADVGKKLGVPLNYNSNIDVWWLVAANELGFEPIAATWSGSSITAHTATGEKAVSYAWHDATIRKLGKRVPGSMERIGPDVVLVYRGTNDLSHSSRVRLTEGFFDTADWECPTTDLLSDDPTYGYKEGMSILITKIRETYPHAQVVLCTCNVFKRSNYNNFPTNNGQFSIPQMNKAIREVADFFGCHVIDLDKCGITFENCYSEGYITDSATTPTHPNATGHAMMGRQAICDLVNKLHIYDIEPIVPAEEEDTGEDTDETTAFTAYIVDPWACWSDGKESATSGYYSIVDYPVEAGATYSIPYGRNYFFEDASHTYVSGGAGGGSATLQVTVPDGCTYITICFKPTEISTAAVSITKTTA